MVKNVSILALLLLIITLDVQAQDVYKILYKNSLVPEHTALRKRVVTTISCDDCNMLPKVENAGSVVDNGAE